MKYFLLIFTFFALCGCFGNSKQVNLPSILTSSDQQFTIPKGTVFYAIQKPQYTELTNFIAEEDLAVIYKGNLLELEQEANARVVNVVRIAKKTNILWGILGSVLSILAAWGTKIVIDKIKKT